MTERSLKDSLEILVDAAEARTLDVEELELNPDDLTEALSVLSEQLPGMEEAELRSALETEDGYSLKELEEQSSQLDAEQSESKWAEKAADLLSNFLRNLSLNGQLDLNPSYHYHE